MYNKNLSHSSCTCRLLSVVLCHYNEATIDMNQLIQKGDAKTDIRIRMNGQFGIQIMTCKLNNHKNQKQCIINFATKITI